MAMKSEYRDGDFNVNELFTLSYNFDALKTMMEFLYNNQKSLRAKVSMLEERQNKQLHNSMSFDKLKLHIDDNVNNYDDNNNNASSEKVKEIMSKDKTEDKNETDNLVSLQSKTCNLKISNNHLQKEKQNSPSNSCHIKIDQNIIDQRIKTLETKLFLLQNSIQSIEAHPIFHKKPEEKLNPIQIKCDIESLKDKDTEIDTKLISIDEILDELKVKVCDFNIYEIFKDTRTENGDIKVAEALIQNLEEKTFKKFSLIDNKIKQNEFDSIKSKKDIVNIKSQLESSTYITNSQIENLSNTQKQSFNNQIETSAKLNIIDGDIQLLNEQLTLTKNEFETENQASKQLNTDLNYKIEGLTSTINTLLSNRETYITEPHFIKLKESLMKKLNDVDTKLNETNPFEKIKMIEKNINDLNENLEMKGNKNDISVLNEKIISLMNQIEYLKESEININNLIDKLGKDINSNHNKLDLFQSWLETLKAENSNNTKIIKRDYNIEFNKRYLDINTFNEYMKLMNKEKERSHKELEDMYNLINVITSDIKSKANEFDMKRIEDYLIGTLEDLKKNIVVKYAEKIDINKKYKIIEQQIKLIIESQVTKSEMGEKWLLAKKPVNIGGHNCASCDSYLGELNQSNEYIFWNKIPVKEPVDALGYRV